MTQNIDEETRKIQFSGKSSYMLALPKKWVEEMGLRSGDQVLVSKQNNSSIVITPKGAPVVSRAGREILVKVSHNDKPDSIARKLVSLYIVGYNMINIRSKEGRLSSAQRNGIKKAARRYLVGTEVIADSTEGITLQILISYPELGIENALRRMFLITESMHRDAIQAIKKLDRDIIDSIIKTDDEVDRFSIYIIRHLKMAVQNSRVLNEIGLAKSADCLGYRLVVKSVERVADHATRIAQESLMLNNPLDEQVLDKIIQLSNCALTLFNESGLALFKRDYNSADDIVEKTNLFTELEKEVLNSVEKGRTLETYYPIRLILEDIQRTAEYASDIAEAVLNMTAEQIVTAQEGQ